MKLLLSVFLFSAIFFFSSVLPLLPPCMVDFSASIHKNYVFLFCNGLLVIIARNSGLISKSPDSDNPGEEQGMKGRSRKHPETETLKTVAVEAVGTELEDEGCSSSVGEENSQRIIVNEEGREGAVVAEEEEEDDEENTEMLSREELNKKCDDFIRKVREGILLEFGNDNDLTSVTQNYFLI